MRLARLAIALTTLGIAIPAIPADEADTTQSQLAAALQGAVDQGTPGISAAIADQHGIVWTGVAGWSDVATRRPITTDSLFGIGSITKIFVAVVVLQLVEEGRLKLTDTPANILGGDAVRGIANTDVATVDQLLGHTAGIPSWEDDPRWIRQARGAAIDPMHRWRRTESLDFVRGTGTSAAAGAGFAYSNSGYTLLGLMVEKITGRSAEGEIRRRVLSPLGLRDTYLEGFEPGEAGRVPHRYHYATARFHDQAGIAPSFSEIRPGLVDTGTTNLSCEWTAGGMISSPRDVVSFARALRDGRLLKPASLSYMMAWHPAFARAEAGHGLFRIHAGDLRLVGHTGGVLGFSAVLWWVEGSDVIAAVLSNGGGTHAGRTPPKATTVGTDQHFVSLAMRLAAQQRQPPDCDAATRPRLPTQTVVEQVTLDSPARSTRNAMP
jgi:D-alanyl-D-alanine carboxypeptidase